MSNANWNIYSYEVDINSYGRNRVKKGLLHRHHKLLGPFIYDGFYMYSGKKYEQEVTI